MRRNILSVLLLACVTFLSAQENIPEWEIVNIVDKFGDETNQKRVVYQTQGIFSNSATTDSKLDVLVFSDHPKSVTLIVYEYGKYRVSLNDGFFYYKIGDRVIEGVHLRGRYNLDINRDREYDENTSLLNLLRQGGEIKVRVYKDNSSYFFIINAGNFLEMQEKAFHDIPTTIEYNYEISDKKGELVHVSFEMSYKWTKEKEELFKDNKVIEKIVIDFFSNVNRNTVFDRPGGYYQKNKVMEEWGVPFFEKIKELFPNEEFEFEQFVAR